jgi:hypothetical protein
MSPKKVYSFMIDPELAEALKAYKDSEGLSESEQIRTALREFYRRRGVPVRRKTDQQRAGKARR